MQRWMQTGLGIGSVNRREFLYYLLFTVIALFSFLLLVLGTWYVTGPGCRRCVHLALAEYPPADIPYKIIREDVTFWLVHTHEALLALDPHTPDWRRCEYNWESPNSRFVDPCHGSKFALDGALLEGPADQSLDRYRIRVEDSTIVVNLARVIPGAPESSDNTRQP